MIEKIREFILIAKKILVLRKEESTTEPKVSVLFNSNGDAFLTFTSSVFPFFTHPGFEEVEEKDLDNFLEKCRNFLDLSEKNYKVDLGVEVPSYKKDKWEQIAGDSFFLSKNGEVTKFTVKRKPFFYKGENKGWCKVFKERLS